MNKSFLTAAVVGFLGTATSGMAFADSMTNASTYCKPGFYVGGQVGRGDTFYHNHDVLIDAEQDSGGLANQKTDDFGIAGRLYAGYQFDPYFAMETGYTRFSKTDFSGDEFPDADYRYTGNVTQSAIDLVGKVTMPLENGFGVYAKAGFSYITSDRYTNVAYQGASSYTLNTKTYQAVQPTYGVGIDYAIPATSLDVDAFYTRTEGHSAIKTTTFWGLGMAYKFA